MNALGSIFYNEIGDFNQAAEWFRKSSGKGCTRSLNNMGICFELGRGVEKDRDRAYLLYKEAAEKGHIQAMENLAYLTFQNGRISKSKQQFKESAQWFRKLTIEDSKRAEPYYQLAQIHEFGLSDGVRDLKLAFQYYRKAARLDHVEALSKCGDFIYSGKGINRKDCCGDRAEAIRCYKRASEMGSLSAMNNLAILLESTEEQKA